MTCVKILVKFSHFLAINAPTDVWDGITLEEAAVIFRRHGFVVVLLAGGVSAPFIGIVVDGGMGGIDVCIFFAL